MARHAPARPALVLLAAVLVGASAARRLEAGGRGDGAPPAVADRGGLAQAPDGRVHLPLLVLGRIPDPPAPIPSPSPSPSPGATATATAGATASALPSAAPTETAGTPAAATAIPPDHEPFGRVRLAPEMRLDGAGAVVDSLAFWEAPDPADTLLLVTAKGNGRVEVWRWPFEGAELPPLEHPSFAAGSLVNGIAVDAARGEAFVAVSRPASTIVVFRLPDRTAVRTLVAGAVDLRTEPNLALLALPDGTRRLYASADDRVHALDPDRGEVVGGFETDHALESLVADDADQVLYIPDETRRGGVYAYDPDGRPHARGGRARFGEAGVFQADAEGIALYACRGADGRDDGRGWLIVSDQRPDETELEVFDRRSWAHLGALVLDGVAATDGVASTRRPLPGHPDGLLAAVDDDEAVVLIGWDRIRAATGLGCASEAPDGAARAATGN